MEFIKLKSFIKIVWISYIGTAEEKIAKTILPVSDATYAAVKKPKNFTLLNFNKTPTR